LARINAKFVRRDFTVLKVHITQLDVKQEPIVQVSKVYVQFAKLDIFVRFALLLQLSVQEALTVSSAQVFVQFVQLAIIVLRDRLYRRHVLLEAIARVDHFNA